MKRFRIFYSKTENLRYVGNLDMQRIWERYLRRSGLKVAYSQGFHPQAKIQQACPLPLGFLSTDEQVDIYLNEDALNSDEVKQIITDTFQPGILINSVEEVELYGETITKLVTSSEYQIDLLEEFSIESLKTSSAELLGMSEILRKRRDKPYDLRPLIKSLAIDSPTVISMELVTLPSATGRPDEVIDALGISPEVARITRTKLNFIQSE
ncbi:MAG TPA: TIGR03936 family radical SAM-associated protein [Bellilinea sp.]|nr:TIGR03936 family radical SAM-associated protein [Bellilinea sp.]